MATSTRSGPRSGTRRSARTLLGAAALVCGGVLLLVGVGASPAEARELPASVSISESRTVRVQDDNYTPTSIPPTPTTAPSTTVPADVAGATTIPSRGRNSPSGQLARTGSGRFWMMVGPLLLVAGILMALSDRRPVAHSSRSHRWR